MYFEDYLAFYIPLILGMLTAILVAVIAVLFNIYKLGDKVSSRNEVLQNVPLIEDKTKETKNAKISQSMKKAWEKRRSNTKPDSDQK
jgi:MFS superfamily sulfate permease-like transporter